MRPLGRHWESVMGKCGKGSDHAGVKASGECSLIHSGTFRFRRSIGGLLAVALMASTPAQAIECSGTVTRVLIQPEGTVFVDFGYGRTRLCELSGPTSVDRGPSWGSTTVISQVACQAFVSAFLTAKASTRRVKFQIDRSDCNMGDGALPTPYPYFIIFE
jgi:hypothetical protein